MNEVKNEVVGHFIPQKTKEFNGRTWYTWETRRGILEVAIPGTKHGKHTHNKAQIIVSVRRVHSPFAYLTSVHEYDIRLLKFLLNVLNRPYRQDLAS